MRAKGHKRKITALERELQALELRKAGATYREIGNALGISDVGAAKALRRAIRKLNERTVEQAAVVRRLELERLDRMQLALWNRATDIKNPDLKAVDRVLKIMDHRAKLLGLYAPVEANVNVTEQLDLSKGITRENVHQVAARLMTVLREVEEEETAV